MNADALLDLMLDDMETAPRLYRPTTFWQSALATIVHDLKRFGFDRFRSQSSARAFYVPCYATPRFQRSPELFGYAARALNAITGKRRLGSKVRARYDGAREAHTDYLVLRAADAPGAPDLLSVGESAVGAPCEHFEFDGRAYSKSLLNYLRGLALLKKHRPIDDVRSFLEIGGGYGTLGEIALKLFDDGFYLDVDIPPVAAVATYYLEQVFGADNVLSYDVSREMDRIDLEELRGKYRCAVLCPWQLEDVAGSFDMFVNFISFQEMEPDVSANYVRLVQPLTERFVLLRNSRHGKAVAGESDKVGVSHPTRIDETVSHFSAFTEIARDAHVFGRAFPEAAFFSEVVCLERRVRR